jgi:hypothetical protein
VVRKSASNILLELDGDENLFGVTFEDSVGETITILPFAFL